MEVLAVEPAECKNYKRRQLAASMISDLRIVFEQGEGFSAE